MTYFTPLAPKSYTENLEKRESMFSLKRVPFLINQQQNIEDSLAELLLADNLQVLELVCRSALVGDAAALASKGILKILSSKDTKGTQAFLKRLFRARILDYRSKQRDLSDITRDNSLITMLLVAYAKEHGSQYIVQTLTQPLNNVYPLLDKCEVDSQKLSGANMEEQIMSGKNHLEQVCEKLFGIVFLSRNKIPDQILEMCRFLATATDELLGDFGDAPPLSPPISPPPDSNSSIPRPRIFGKLKDREGSFSPSSGQLSGSFQADTKAANLYLVMAESVPLPSVMMEKHENLQRAIRSSVAIVEPEKSKLSNVIQPSSESIISSVSVVKSVNTIQDKSKTLGNLSTSEKIIGSFLFLRFIVPGITSPEANGIIMTEKITSKARRGLVLTGKMMTSLCNDNEFGNKDASLIPCNQFLIPYRTKMKEFLSICAEAEAGESPEPRPIVGRTNKEKTAMNRMSSFDALKKDNPLGNKNFSMSMNNLRINPPKVEKDADISAFYQQLYKSIDKLEKDVMEKRKDMLPEKASILTKRFQSLKSLLEKGGYAPREVIAKKNPWYAFLTKSFKMRQKS